MFKTTQAINEDMDDIFPTTTSCPNCGEQLTGQFFIRHHIKDCNSQSIKDLEDEDYEDKKESVKKLTDILGEKI